jgi:hypothetical protein
MVICALATACAAETVELPPPVPAHWQASTSSAPSSTTPTEKERAVAAAYTKALASPRLAALGPLLDEEVLFAFGAQNMRGRERVLKAHENMFGAFDGRRFLASRVWLTDSRTALNSQTIEWTMTGAQAREWMRIPPTGKNVAIKGLTLLWATDEGVITEIHVYFNEDVVKAQLGRGPLDLGKVPGSPAPDAKVAEAEILERSGTPEETANVALVRDMLQALERDKEVAFLSTLADDVDVTSFDGVEAMRGKAAARAYFRSTRRSIRQLDTVVQNLWGVRSFAIIEYALTGLQIAPWQRFPVPKDGALHQIHAQFVDVAEISLGKITRIRRYDDSGSLDSP